MISSNFSNPATSILAIGCVSLLVVLLWLYLDSANNITIAEVVEKELIWQNSEPENYNYKLIYGCMFIEQKQVKVRGEILQTYNFEVSFPYMFKQIKKAVLSAYNYEVEFHPLGYPVSFSVDWAKSVIDDECFFVIEEFEVLLIQ